MLAFFVAVLCCPLADKNSRMEYWLSVFPVAFSVVVANLFIFAAYFQKHKASVIRLIPILILTVALLFTTSQRSFRVQQWSWIIDGTVVQKYKSENHGALSIEVSGPSEGQFEFVDRNFWTLAKPGDQLKKAAFSATALLNGREIKIVQK
jgi:hypothetical protein